MLAADAGAAIESAVIGSAIPSSTSTQLTDVATRLDSSRHSIVFLDSSVDDVAELSSGVLDGSEIVILDSARSGLQQISQVLASRSKVDSIHLVGHGAEGQLQLGADKINAQSLQRSADQLRSWKNALNENADVLVYGCESAAGSSGAALLSTIARLTGADVAGSTNATGHERHGADWILERQLGVIESRIAFTKSAMRSFRHHLPITIAAAGVENTEQMRVSVGGQEVGTFNNIGGDAYAGLFQNYTLDLDGVSIEDIRIDFTNDLFDEVAGVDRNLRIDKVTVDGVDYQTESPTVYSTGTWLPADGVVPGFRQNEFLHATGSFDFGGAPTDNGSVITINASGQTGEEAFELQIDGQSVAQWESVPQSGGVYTFQADAQVSADQVRVVFTNDQIDPVSGADRNLDVDKISIDGVDFETEAPTVFSTGTWKPDDGITAGFRESETLHANGYFQYGVSDPDPNPEPGTIVIRTAGTTGQENIQLQINGQTVASYDSLGNGADTRSFREFVYQASGSVDPSDVRVVFTNDFSDEAAGIDRNVIVDHIRIDGQTFETESPDVFSTGTWLPEDGVTAGFRQNETLHTDGYFQFAAEVGEPGFIGLGATQFTVNEDDGSVTITFVRYDGDRGTASIFYQTVAGEAGQGTDFLGTDSGRVDFADGQTTATTTVDLVDDSVLESIETFSVSLFRAEGAELGVPRTAIVTIVDDEAGRDLIANWRLDETSLSSTVIDAGGNGNDGSFRNFANGDPLSGPRNDAPNVQSGNPGSVLFDGVNDFVQIGPDPSLDLSTSQNTGRFTQSVWIKPTGTANGYQGVLGYQPGVTAERYPGIWVYQQDRIHAGFGDGTNWNSFNTGSVLTTGEWNHVATTFDGTTYSAFVNGTLVFTTTDFAGRTPAGTNRVDIGRVDNYFQGGIDDARIYNRALSAQEISVLIDGADVPAIPVDGQFVTNELYAGFDTPLAVDFLPDGRLVVLEQAGFLRLINSDGTQPSTPLLDIADRVNSGTKDRGALGFAIHPDFENNPYVYVSYTYDPPEVNQNTGLGGPDGNGARVSRISRFTVNAAGTFADPDSEFVLVGNASTYENIGNPNIRPGLNDPHSCFDENGDPLEDCIPADETSHTIGDLEFGIDGMLYASSGDGGSFGRVDPVNLRALDIDSLAGKVLRIDPITGQGLADNPFFDGDPDSNASKVYQYGLRNPFRLAVNRQTGDIYNGDVGWTQWEEINTGRGANFGWPAFEGGDNESLRTRRYQDLQEVQDYYATNPDVTAPVWARLHSDGARAIVMGDFIGEGLYPEQFNDSLLFTDIGDQVLRVANFDAAGNVTSVDTVSDAVGFIVDVQLRADGFLYYVDITGKVGRLEYQIA